jgi:hypothetical protein
LDFSTVSLSNTRCPTWGPAKLRTHVISSHSQYFNEKNVVVILC